MEEIKLTYQDAVNVIRKFLPSWWPGRAIPDFAVELVQLGFLERARRRYGRD